MKAYQVTLRDRETQTVVGYYNGAWTTDQRRALTTVNVRRQRPAPLSCAIAARATLSSLPLRRPPRMTDSS